MAQVLGFIGSAANGEAPACKLPCTSAGKHQLSSLQLLEVLTAKGGLLISGAAMPIFALVIGRMVNTLGKGGDPNALYAQLNDTTLFFLYLAIVSFFVCYLELAMWMLTGKPGCMEN